MKCREKIDILTRSSAGASKLPTCKYFSKLHLVRDTTSNRATITNLTLGEPQDGNSNSALNDSSQIWEEEIPSPEAISSERVSTYETITSQTVAESALFERLLVCCKMFAFFKAILYLFFFSFT